MTDYLRLRLRQARRSLTGDAPGRMLAFVALGLVVAVGAQLLLLGGAADSPLGDVEPTARVQAEAGYAVLLLAALSMLTGPQSSRFPCTPADVAWVYASPLPIGALVAAQLVWQAARRCAFWIVGGALADLLATLALDSAPGTFLTCALLAAPLLAALVTLSVGAGCTRGSPVPARAAAGAGAVLAAAVLVPLAFELLSGSVPGHAVDGATLSAVARSVGAVLFGKYDLLAAVALAAMAVLGAVLCRAGGPGLREQVTLDAAFWAEFSATSTQVAVRRSKPSFRRLARLSGPWAILWFEIAVSRRVGYQRWSLVVLLGTAALSGAFTPEVVPLLALAAPLGALTGAYFSGLARHLRLSTLVLAPAGTAGRVAAAEAVPAVLACAGLGLSLAVGGIAGGYDVIRIGALFLQGIVLSVAAFAARVAAAALGYGDGVLPGTRFHVALAVAAAGATGVLAVTWWVARALGAPLAVTWSLLLGAGAALLAGAIMLLDRRIEPRGRRGRPRSGQRGRASSRSATTSTAATTGLSGS